MRLMSQLPTRPLGALRDVYVPRIEAVVAKRRAPKRRAALFGRLTLPARARRHAAPVVFEFAPLRRRALEWGAAASDRARHTLEATGSVAAVSSTARRAGRRPLPVLAVGVAAGALGMYYLDPHAGRRRRGLVRDRLRHLRNVVTRKMPRTVERKGRYVGGVAKGLRHDVAEMVHRDGHHAHVVDDETLVARVRSEVLREREIKAGEIHVDAYEGCVTLRGQLEHEDDIRHLIEAARHVEGVREVRSYLHLPGALPPNKAESYTHVPAEFVRSS